MLKSTHPDKVMYYGSIGKDEVGEVLRAEAEKVSFGLTWTVWTAYQLLRDR